MRLAKRCIDVGVFTNNADALLGFWHAEAGLPYEELLPIGGGVRQHRHAMNGSVFKLNDVRDALVPDPPAGYRELLIARPGLTERRTLVDPDGSVVTLVPPGEEEITQIGVRLAVRDEDAFNDFYGRTLGLDAVGHNAYRCGESVLRFAHSPNAQRTTEIRALGYRYLTIQVWDVDAEHHALVARGAEEGSVPVTIGSTARISFVRDPDGNWIEISQRASLTGPLPTVS